MGVRFATFLMIQPLTTRKDRNESYESCLDLSLQLVLPREIAFDVLDSDGFQFDRELCCRGYTHQFCVLHICLHVTFYHYRHHYNALII